MVVVVGVVVVVVVVVVVSIGLQQYLWCCHDDTDIARVHRVHPVKADGQMVVDPNTKPV